MEGRLAVPARDGALLARLGCHGWLCSRLLIARGYRRGPFPGWLAATVWLVLAQRHGFFRGSLGDCDEPTRGYRGDAQLWFLVSILSCMREQLLCFLRHIVFDI